VTGAPHRERRVPSNKRMKLSKPGDLGGSWPAWSGIIESGFAAYAQCWADLTEDCGTPGPEPPEPVV
jgi:hypothetical protein